MFRKLVAHPNEGMNNSEKLILIVDDSSTNNLLFEHILKNEGYSVIISDNGEDALKKTRHKGPDLVLLDIALPGMDGFQVLQKIKENEKTSTVPVIMVSAKNDTWSVKTAMDLGAVDYLMKPINVESFLKKVNTTLDN